MDHGQSIGTIPLALFALLLWWPETRALFRKMTRRTR